MKCHCVLFVSECPPTLSGKRRFYCPSANDRTEWICVTSEQICDTQIDCPDAHDEDELMCFYHRPVSFCQHTWCLTGHFPVFFISINFDKMKCECWIGLTK